MTPRLSFSETSVAHVALQPTGARICKDPERKYGGLLVLIRGSIPLGSRGHWDIHVSDDDLVRLDFGTPQAYVLKVWRVRGVLVSR
jgi:hypothetical protein